MEEAEEVLEELVETKRELEGTVELEDLDQDQELQEPVEQEELERSVKVVEPAESAVL